MNTKKLIRDTLLHITPTFTYPLLRTIVQSPIFHFLEANTPFGFFSPQWNTVKSGPFKGISVYYDSSSNFWSHETSDGMHDKEIFSFLLKQKLKGGVVFDIGAHIGFNSLCYAQLVGDSGTVVAFEPNPFNRERLHLNLSHNHELEKRILVHPIAISDKNGMTDFYFTNAIEDGTSSGSAIKSAKDENQMAVYTKYGFEKMKVKTLTLDAFISKSKLIPNVVKIDIEGAEHLVMKGAIQTLKKYKPLFLIELHTVYNGYKVTEILSKNGYNVSLLKVENDGRTFIAAKL